MGAKDAGGGEALWDSAKPGPRRMSQSTQGQSRVALPASPTEGGTEFTVRRDKLTPDSHFTHLILCFCFITTFAKVNCLVKCPQLIPQFRFISELFFFVHSANIYGLLQNSIPCAQEQESRDDRLVGEIEWQTSIYCRLKFYVRTESPGLWKYLEGQIMRGLEALLRTWDFILRTLADVIKFSALLVLLQMLTQGEPQIPHPDSGT